MTTRFLDNCMCFNSARYLPRRHKNRLPLGADSGYWVRTAVNPSRHQNHLSSQHTSGKPTKVTTSLPNAVCCPTKTYHLSTCCLLSSQQMITSHHSDNTSTWLQLFLVFPPSSATTLSTAYKVPTTNTIMVYIL